MLKGMSTNERLTADWDANAYRCTTSPASLSHHAVIQVVHDPKGPTDEEDQN